MSFVEKYQDDSWYDHESEDLVKEVRSLASLLDMSIGYSVPAGKEDIQVKRAGDQWKITFRSGPSSYGEQTLNHFTDEWVYVPTLNKNFFFATLFEAIKAARKKSKTLERDLEEAADALAEKHYPAERLVKKDTKDLIQLLQKNRLFGGYPTAKQLKTELATREHIPNKTERKANRQESARKK